MNDHIFYSLDHSLIPLMENKAKSTSKTSKKKKFTTVAIELSDMSTTNKSRGDKNNYVPNISREQKTKTSEDTAVSVPLLHIWPSRRSSSNNLSSHNRIVIENNLAIHSGDSGIESTQASPIQKSNINVNTCGVEFDDNITAGPSGTNRRFSSIFLHPDRARYSNRSNTIASTSRDNIEIDMGGDFEGSLSAASSDASSLMSVSGVCWQGARNSDPWGRRRSSTWTGRFSDVTDPEFAHLRNIARGSVGMHSLSESLQKLTFTQTLAFPELARKLATKRRQEQLREAATIHRQDDFEACSKFVAVAGVFLLSLMVYGVVVKYAKV
ncbi:uncharacterized protein LOC126899360 [Daktulosphaira vitifoliae]|uniref:uncharacterized protein LOC126899360 n=1 Tax=Daktulosphaira vitifoliae TaxID=58002 RepID=UPI0021AAEF09|nr:uncharacterized protein LOC126899360 [Daktulosphaira vitifoliae]